MEVKRFEHSVYYEDRGEIFAFYDQKDHDLNFIQDRCSISYKGGVRGFHGDPLTWKYITCPIGEIHIVTWDLENKKKQEFVLSEQNKESILIPPYFINAHQCLSHMCLFMYKQTEYYETCPADKQWSIYYNDETIDPNWTIRPKRVSQRDSTAMRLSEFYNE